MSLFDDDANDILDKMRANEPYSLQYVDAEMLRELYLKLERPKTLHHLLLEIRLARKGFRMKNNMLVKK